LSEVRDVVCPFCGCLCDDLVILVEEGKIAGVKNGCALSITKYLNYNRERISKPMVRKNGELEETSLEEAVNRAAELLANADYPVSYGWSNTSCEAIATGIELMEEVGGVIDNTSVVCHGPSVLGVHEVGHPTCTLGEIKNRADLIIYWASNPLQSHPRHLSRYTVMARGKFRKSRDERTLIVVDVRKTYTARVADYFIQIQPGKDYELLSALRTAVRGEELEQEEVAGVKREHIEEVADLLISCEFGVLFWGVGLTMTGGKYRNIDLAISLVRDLNAYTKFVMMPMRGHYNVVGANAVFTWQTGYPYAVDFSHGYPRYNPGETSVTDILVRGEADAALIVASDPASNFPRKAVEHLSRIPVVLIDPRWTSTTDIAEVVIPTAMLGIEVEGTAYRMDGVPIHMKKVINPPDGLKPDVEILRMILDRIRAMRGG